MRTTLVVEVRKQLHSFCCTYRTPLTKHLLLFVSKHFFNYYDIYQNGFWFTVNYAKGMISILNTGKISIIMLVYSRVSMLMVIYHVNIFILKILVKYTGIIHATGWMSIFVSFGDNIDGIFLSLHRKNGIFVIRNRQTFLYNILP